MWRRHGLRPGWARAGEATVPGPLGADSGRARPLGGACLRQRPREAAGLLTGGGRAGRRTIMGARGMIGLWVWRKHFLPQPDGPSRPICARFGLSSAAAQALECRPCEPIAQPPCGCFSRCAMGALPPRWRPHPGGWSRRQRGRMIRSGAARGERVLMRSIICIQKELDPFPRLMRPSGPPSLDRLATPESPSCKVRNSSGDESCTSKP